MRFTSASARAEWRRLFPRAGEHVGHALAGAARHVDVHLGAQPGTVALFGSGGCDSALYLSGSSLYYEKFLPAEGCVSRAWSASLAAARSLGIIDGRADFSDDQHPDDLPVLLGFSGGAIDYSGSSVTSPPECADDDVIRALATKRLALGMDHFRRARRLGPCWLSPVALAEEVASGSEDSVFSLHDGPLPPAELLSASAFFSADPVRVTDPSMASRLRDRFVALGGAAGAAWACRAAARFRMADRSPWPPSPDGKHWHPQGANREDRRDMPQIGKDDLEDFLTFCKSAGVGHDRVQIACGLLEASQKTIDAEKAWKLARSKDLGALLGRVLVSSEGVLLDGHHRWAALVLRGDPRAPLDCIKLNADFSACLDLARRFFEQKGQASFVAAASGSVAPRLVEAAEGLSEDLFLDGYGSLHYRPESGEVYYVTSDSNEREDCEKIARVLGAIVGRDKVRIESEASPPDGEGWVRLFPTRERKPGLADFALSIDYQGGYDHRAYVPEDDEDDEVGQMIRLLKHRLKKPFGEEQREAVRDLLLGMETEQALRVYHGLVKGGDDPEDAEQAAWKLYRVLGKLPRFEGPDSPASYRHLLARFESGLRRVRALRSMAKTGILARRAFASSWKALDRCLRDVLRVPGRLDGSTDPQERPGLASKQTGLADASRSAKEARDLVAKEGAKARDALARMLEPRHPARWEVSGDGLSHRSFAEAYRWVSSLVARRGGEKGEIVLKVTLDHESRRSTFLPPAAIRLCPTDGVRACCHLLGHVLEAQLEGARELCEALLEFRTGEEVATDLGMVEGGMALRGEEGRLGTFDAYFRGTDAWYCGKVNHEGGGSEIVSMGLEALWEDPAAFARADAEYCLTMIGILTGDLRGRWPVGGKKGKKTEKTEKTEKGEKSEGEKDESGDKGRLPDDPDEGR